MYNVDINKSCDDSTNFSSSLTLQNTHLEFLKIFFQKDSKFGLKSNGEWTTVNEDNKNKFGEVGRYLNEHLYGVNGRQGRILGAFSMAYTQYAILDIDDRDAFDLDKIRNLFNLRTEFSRIDFETSHRSYHILFKPVYDGKQVSVKLLHKILGPYIKHLKIELFPKLNHPVRVPFHYGHKLLRSNDNSIKDLTQFLEAFNDLSTLELKSFVQDKKLKKELVASRDFTLLKPSKGVMKEGYELYTNGLVESQSRYASQHKVAMYLWQRGMDKDQALNELMSWVVSKNNGYSKDAKSLLSGCSRTLYQVKKEHEHIVDYIWNSFVRRSSNSNANSVYGWYTKKDIILAAKYSDGSIPRFKFLAHLLAYFNKFKSTRLNISKKKLSAWSSNRSYLKHLEYLEDSRVLFRDDHYAKDDFSKIIELHLSPSMSEFSECFNDGDDNALSFEKSLDELGRKEVYDILVQNGFSKSQSCNFVERLCLV